MTLGEKNKDMGNFKKLSQIDLANLLNVDKSTIAKYETDVVVPSVNMIIILAKFFEVSTDYLLGFED